MSYVEIKHTIDGKEEVIGTAKVRSSGKVVSVSLNEKAGLVPDLASLFGQTDTMSLRDILEELLSIESELMSDSERLVEEYAKRIEVLFEKENHRATVTDISKDHR